MGPRARVLLNGAVTVVALALIIVGLWAFTSPKKTPEAPVAARSNPTQQSAQFYRAGLDALSAEQTGTAIALFEKALKADPSNTDAKKALDGAKKPASSGSSTTSSASSSAKPKATAPASEWTKKLALPSLLPTAFPGYTVGGVEQGGPSDANVSAAPAQANAPVTSVLWTVHDRGTASGANAFLASVSKKLYSKDAAQVRVSDVTAYFGTDGQRFATVAYVRGRYVFEVIVTAQAPAGARELASRAAAGFSVSP
jgi:hypothetical protein